jgi:hypothetical protein
MKALNICCASVKDILYGEYMPLYAYACNKWNKYSLLIVMFQFHIFTMKNVVDGNFFMTNIGYRMQSQYITINILYDCNFFHVVNFEIL